MLFLYIYRSTDGGISFSLPFISTIPKIYKELELELDPGQERLGPRSRGGLEPSMARSSREKDVDEKI